LKRLVGARGLDIGEEMTMRSTIGSRFGAEILDTVRLGDQEAILPRITGRAWIYSIGQYGVDPDDPFPHGFTLSDTWGTGIDHVIPPL